METHVQTHMKKNLFLLLAAAALLCACAGPSGKSAKDPDGQRLFIGEDIAVANTQYGRVRGFILDDIYQFRGIPYGASTAGENRFMPPQPPQSWDDVRPALMFGESAPQVVAYDRRPESYGGFTDHWNYDLIGEDCLRLNVWTPGLDGEKRPVLVWLHGGGYSSGNAIEQDGYGGENLARYGNVVCCSVNHRLNSFGFSDFASVGGEKYLHSGNVGMLDIIAALQWVHDNIANFGGDPGNVTIIGQSGGGGKVSVIATMPAAKGLVHKGVALSGNAVSATDKAYAEALGAHILKEAGLKPSQIDRLQQMPWEEYYALANRAARSFRGTPAGGRAGFSPVGDGVDIPAGTFFDPADASLPNIPILLCPAVPGPAADRNLVHAPVHPHERGPLGGHQVRAGRPGLCGLVPVAAAPVRRPHARLPLPGHLLLAAQHRRDAHPYRRRCQAARAFRQDVRRAAGLHAHRRSQLRRPAGVAEVHAGKRRGDDPG